MERINRSEESAQRMMLEGRMTNADYARDRAMREREKKKLASHRTAKMYATLALAAIIVAIGFNVFKKYWA